LTESTETNRILVDTDVFSYIFGEKEQAKYFLPHIQGKTLAVSFMTVAQLYAGAYKVNWNNSKLQKLENQLKNYAVFPYDFSLCLKWAEIEADCENSGYRIETGDCWIAACAMKYECQLVTNNRRHFEHIKGLNLFAPSLGIT